VTQQRAILARDVLQAIGSCLVSDRESFRVETDLEGASITVFSLHCAAKDKGHLIGKGGRMFRALLVIVKAIGVVRGEQLSISEVHAPGSAVTLPKSKPPFNPDWPREAVKWLAEAICSAVFDCPVSASIREMDKGGCVTVELASHRKHLIQSSPDRLESIRTVFTSIGINHGCSLLIDFT
jgi:predicted RNA-binding protein YlqC (UPF0109 family)